MITSFESAAPRCANVLSRPLASALLVLAGLATPALRAADGDPLATGIAAFDAGGNLNDTANAVAVQADGKIVLVGTVATGSSTSDLAIARFLPDGSPDLGFGTNGRIADPFGVAQNTFGRGVVALADGRILVAGRFDWGAGDSDFLIGRLLANGQPDPAFGTTAPGLSVVWFDLGGFNADQARALAVDGSGRIVVVGSVTVSSTDYDFAVARLLSSGALDTSFAGDGRAVVGFPGSDVDSASAVAIDLSGRILVGGAANPYATFDTFLIRLLDSGTLDSTFGSNGLWLALHDGGTDWVNALAVQPDGRILLAGENWLGPGLWSWMVERLMPDGVWDTSFSDDGFQAGNFACGVGMGCDYQDRAFGLALQGDGKIVIGGVGRGSNNFDFGAARLQRDGTPDLSFGFNDTGVYDGTIVFDFNRGPGAHDDVGTALALAPDGRLVVAGSSEWNGLDTDFAWVRLDNSYVFADGFEWGSASAWSSTLP